MVAWCKAAAGGLGLLLCQMAKLRGSKVIGRHLQRGKIPKFVTEAGADEVPRLHTIPTSPKEGPPASPTAEASNVVYDGVGKDTFQVQSRTALAPAGLPRDLWPGPAATSHRSDIMNPAGKGSLFLHSHQRPNRTSKEYPNLSPSNSPAWLREKKGSPSRIPQKPTHSPKAAQAHAALRTPRKSSAASLLLP